MKNKLIIIAVLSSTLGFSQSWNQVVVPSTDKLNDIEFASNAVGYISGDNETLLKTMDGGESWTTIIPAGISVPFTYNIGDLEFVSETVGFCNVPNAGSTYKTLDGGDNWTLVDDTELGNFCYRGTIYAESENQYLLGGAGCFQSAMIKENNGGVWSEKVDALENFNADEQVVQMDFFNQLGIAATSSQYFLRTIDGGQFWDTILAPISAGSKLTSVVIVDALNMLAGYEENGSGFGVLRSNNAGLTWTIDNNSGTFFYPSFLSVEVAMNGDLYAGAQPSNSIGGLMFESTDGTNWLYEMVDQPIYAIDTYDNDIVFAVGDSGYVITNTDFGSLGVTENESLKINLYPNPTADWVSINSDALFNVKVTNIQGQIVLEKQSQTNKMDVDISHLSQGMYQFIIEQDNGISLKKVMKY